jgi:RNA methyltransferase, TrmH family
VTFIQLTSLQHPLVKHLSKLQQQRAYRSECKQLVIEGKKLIRDVHHLIEVQSLLVTDESLIPEDIVFKTGYHVTDAIIQKITGSLSPEGIVAEITMPSTNHIESCRSLVVLDRIQDPGNVGNIIRTASAFGWDGVYCIHGTCDCWNDKVLRAARGATFHLPIQYGSWNELMELLKTNQITPYAADLGGQSIDNVDRSSHPIALVLGNEGQGLSKEVLENCKKITIPISNQMESLNVSVAGGILMYMLRDQHHDQ